MVPTGTIIHKKKFIIIFALVAAGVVAVAVGLGLWMTSPKRTLDKFVNAIEAKDYDAAMAQVSETTSESKRNNIEWFVEDWTVSETLEVEFDSDASWQSRIKMTKNDQGEDVPVMNEHGYETIEQKPAPKYWAHHYESWVTVTFDDFEDPVIIRLARQSSNKDTWSPLAQIFRPWKVTNIKYQPFDEEDLLDYELDDEAFFDETLEEGEEEDETGDEEDTEEPAEEEGSQIEVNKSIEGGLVEPSE